MPANKPARSSDPRTDITLLNAHSVTIVRLRNVTWTEAYAIARRTNRTPHAQLGRVVTLCDASGAVGSMLGVK